MKWTVLSDNRTNNDLLETMSRGLIIFDFDGTLGDTRRNIVTTMQMTIAELHLPKRSEAACAATIGLPLAGCFRALFPDIQDEIIPRCAETYRRIFNENLQNIHPEAFPGVVETLSILHRKGFTLTIASSRSHNSLTELTLNMGIADYISYLLGADDVKEAKPKPEPVLKTLAAMHFDAGETLVVGDMAVDIQMGAHAGAKTCGVTWGNGTKAELEAAGATFIIDRIEDLIEIVDHSDY
jgi:phosphoglycolate phosphatase